MRWGSLNFQDIETSIQRVSLNLRDLYTDEDELTKFKERWTQFKDPTNSDHSTSEIYEHALEDDWLTYETETLLPRKKSDKMISLLLLLGNPASHSIKERMFFSFEQGRASDRREHRFWDVLALSCVFAPRIAAEGLDERNMIRKQKIYTLDYDSHFRIGLAVFYSMPNASSGKWSGVAGLRRLFGKAAFEKITAWEKQRIESLIADYAAPDGIVVAFQKDAYVQIKSDDSPKYKLSKVKAEGIKGRCESQPNVKLYCLAPTRLMRMNLKLLKMIQAEHNSRRAIK